MAWLRRGGWRRGGGVCVALLALALRLAAPTGWMLAPAEGHGAPRLVICTGHGPAELAASRGDPTRTPSRSADDHPCVGAGAATPPAPQLPAVPSIEPRAAAADAPLAALADQRPGRGLAAPPPPSHAPPASPDRA